MESVAPGRGLFVTFEGGEGVGKSTQIDMLADALRHRGVDVVKTREPGGSPGAEAVRHALLSGAIEKFGPDAEAILFAAARSDHVETLIRPALKAGKTVLCDRFFDSTRVYQGVTGKVDPALLTSLEMVACEDCWPDLTLILDLDPAIGMQRAAARRSANAVPDRFEKEALSLQRKRRKAFLDIARREPQRCKVIDASGPAQEIHEAILAAWLQTHERLRARTGSFAGIDAQERA